MTDQTRLQDAVARAVDQLRAIEHRNLGVDEALRILTDLPAEGEDAATFDLAIACPACGQHHLVADDLGNVICMNEACDRPTAVHDLLEDPELGHIVAVDREGSFTVRHPLNERLQDDLFSCDLLAHLNSLSLPMPAGVYRFDQHPRIRLWNHARILGRSMADVGRPPREPIGTQPMLCSSADWAELVGVDVLDPDGWDRKNFDASWSEAISFPEFYRRCRQSTSNLEWLLTQPEQHDKEQHA
jgi:hypothetical protein